MPRSKALINLVNGQLGILAPSEFGTTFILIATPVAPVAGYGVAFKITSKAEVKTAFAQAGNEDVVTAFNDYYFAEAPEGTQVYVLCMAQSTTLQTLVAAANAEKALYLAAGAARIGAAIKFPSGSYAPTITDGFDVDVHNAVTDAQTLATSWLAKNKPFRILIDGFACTGTYTDAKDYATDSKRNCFIVAGEVNAKSQYLTMLALGRLAKIPSQQNMGRVKNGSLNIADTAAITIGGTPFKNVTSATLDGYYDRRYITLDANEDEPGYILTDDMALTVVTDDYNNMRYGRVIDNAVRVAYSTYYRELKDDVDVDENGRLSKVVEKSLENAIKTNVALNMPGQMSVNKDGTPVVECYVNPDVTAYAALYAANGISNPNLNMITNGGNMYVFISMRPKGSIKNINIYIGFAI